MSGSEPTLILEPADALNDEPISVRIEGLRPDQRLSINALLRNDDASIRWTGGITVQAGKDGVVDLSTQAPLSGSYTTIDPNGLLWSLTPEAGAAGGRAAADGLNPLTLELTATIDGNVVAQAAAKRRPIDPSVTVRQVRENGIFVNLFLPPGEAPFPTVVVLGGSGGGFSDGLAALYASHGYAAVSVAYFGIEGLPPELLNIPLEYFEGVIAWITAQPEFDLEHLSVSGTSRGGELALLLASRYSIFKSVVAYVPSGYIWGAVSRSESNDPNAFPSWTYGGQPIAYVDRIRNDAVAPNADGILNLTPAFLHALENEERATAGAIEVEKINGPILMVSGRDDALWPSAVFADLIAERLTASGFPHEVQNLTYEGAGHTIGPRFGPATVTKGFHPIRKATIGYGGNPAAIAAARFDSWPRVLAFLEQYVKTPSGATTVS
jgi:dienelactone hydrolase